MRTIEQTERIPVRIIHINLYYAFAAGVLFAKVHNILIPRHVEQGPRERRSRSPVPHVDMEPNTNHPLGGVVVVIVDDEVLFRIAEPSLLPLNRSI